MREEVEYMHPLRPQESHEDEDDGEEDQERAVLGKEIYPFGPNFVFEDEEEEDFLGLEHSQASVKGEDGMVSEDEDQEEDEEEGSGLDNQDNHHGYSDPYGMAEGSFEDKMEDEVSFFMRRSFLSVPNN